MSALSQNPLHIVKSNGQLLETNAFLVPQFGGVTIVNPSIASNNDFNGKNTSAQRMILDADALKPVMEVFAAQMRGLLGVKQVWMMDQFSGLLVSKSFERCRRAWNFFWGGIISGNNSTPLQKACKCQGTLVHGS